MTEIENDQKLKILIIGPNSINQWNNTYLKRFKLSPRISDEQMLYVSNVFIFAATVIPRRENLLVINVTQLEKDAILVCYDSE